MFISGDNSTVVVDIGTETYKVGYSKIEYPSQYASSASLSNDYTSPVSRSVVSDIDGYCTLLNELLPPDTSYLLISENTFENEECKTKILSNCMEQGMCDALIFSKSAILDTFSYGKTSSIVVSISGGSTQVSCVIDGYITQRHKINYGCIDITKNFLSKTDLNKSYDSKIEKYKNMETGKMLKEDFYKNLSDINRGYTGSVRDLNYRNQFMSTHSKILECTSLINDVLDNCPVEKKNLLMNNIICTGGGSMISNIGKEIENKLKWCKVSCSPSTFHTFSGGVVMGNVGYFKSLFIGKEDYKEYGLNILERKNHSWIQM